MSGRPRPAETDNPSETASCRFVLVRPTHPGNVGASARALKNMGFTDLRIVGQASLGQHPDAVRMAHGAEDLLGNIRWYTSLQEALLGCRWSLGTTRRSRKPRACTASLRGLRDQLRGSPSRYPLALVFGPEKDGLGFEDLALCQGSLTIASNPEHASLNLAQAVMLVAWELSELAAVQIAHGSGAEATHEELEGLFAHIEAMLQDIGFVQTESARPQMLTLRGLLARTLPTIQEVTLLRGICRQASWAAKRTAQPPAGAPLAGLSKPPANNE